MKKEFIGVIDISEFVLSYLHTASWVTCEGGENTQFTKEAIKAAKSDCIDFINMCMNAFGRDAAYKLLTIPGNDLTYLAPHDFFLTRNSHGAGFWDKEEVYGKYAAECLTRISHDIGSVECVHVRGPKSKLTFI